MLCQWGNTHKKPKQTNWEGVYPGQVTQTGQRNILHHRTLCPVRELRAVTQKHDWPGFRGRSLTSVSGWWAIAFCITWFSHNIIIINIVIIISSSSSNCSGSILFNFQLLNCSHLNIQILLWFFSPVYQSGGKEMGGWIRGCVVFHLLLGLNNNNITVSPAVSTHFW